MLNVFTHHSKFFWVPSQHLIYSYPSGFNANPHTSSLLSCRSTLCACFAPLPSFSYSALASISSVMLFISWTLSQYSPIASLNPTLLLAARRCSLARSLSLSHTVFTFYAMTHPVSTAAELLQCPTWSLQLNALEQSLPLSVLLQMRLSLHNRAQQCNLTLLIQPKPLLFWNRHGRQVCDVGNIYNDVQSARLNVKFPCKLRMQMPGRIFCTSDN